MPKPIRHLIAYRGQARRWKKPCEIRDLDIAPDELIPTFRYIWIWNFKRAYSYREAGPKFRN